MPRSCLGIRFCFREHLLHSTENVSGTESGSLGKKCYCESVTSASGLEKGVAYVPSAVGYILRHSLI